MISVWVQTNLPKTCMNIVYLVKKYSLFGTLCMLTAVNMYCINKIITLNNFLNTVLYSLLFETKH